MWALRRASVPLRNSGFRIGTSESYFIDSISPITCIQDHTGGIFKSPQLIQSDKFLSFKRFHCTDPVYANFFLVKREFSSEAGAKSTENDLDDGVSELGSSHSAAQAVQGTTLEDEDELVCEQDFSVDDDGNGYDDDDVEPSPSQMELSETENIPTKERFMRKSANSELFKAIMDSPGLSVHGALDKWVEEGNELTREEVFLAMISFRKFRMYGRALQLSEWLEGSNQFEFDERNYASRVDLIAKVHGLKKAEDYIERIPNSCRLELVYRILLANCVRANNVTKAEEVFKKMKDLGFPITTFSSNQLLKLYKRHNKEKFADVLLLMEKENVKPSLFTYKVLIAMKGQLNDITGVEQILEKMKAEGIEQDRHTRFILARIYVHSGSKDKAEALLKEMEGSNLEENRQVCQNLLILYAELGKADEVERVWKVCETEPLFWECMAAIEAWGKLKKIEEAEAVFDRMLKTWKKPSSKPYNLLLKIYAANKLLIKGKDLIKRMEDSGCRSGPLAWNALVKLYVEAGEVKKADSILTGFAQQSHMKPLPSSYMAIMYQYAKRGDVHNSEKIFDRMRQAGYTVQRHHFQTLVRAYINAKAPAYGMRQRMKAYKIIPDNVLLEQIRKVDAFRKTTVSYLLD